MRKARIILGIVAALTALALCAGTIRVWSTTGAPTSSLIVGCGMYIVLVATGWWYFDGLIKERNK